MSDHGPGTTAADHGDHHAHDGGHGDHSHGDHEGDHPHGGSIKTYIAVTVALCVPNAADDLVAGKVSKLPAIDGKADDDAWKTAKEVVVKIDQPDEEAPYPIRTAFQRCLASSAA